MNESRVCKKCGVEKPIKSFGFSSSGYRERVCGSCRERSKRVANPTRMLEVQRERRERLPHLYIVRDSRYYDKKRGLDNDLDPNFVMGLLTLGCKYCGDRAIRMTLDRVDNHLGHLKSNVVPCCLRCNYLRGSMPYEAWVHLVPAIRGARELGLFGSWGSTPFNKGRKRITGV